MRLLWAFSTFAIGGPQRRFASLIERLDPSFQHVVIALDGNREAEQFLPANGRWSRHELTFEKSSFVSFSNLRAIRRTLDEFAPDLILTSNWGAIEWAIANRGRRRIPHIHFEDGFGPDESASRQNQKRVLARRAFLRGRIVVVPSTTLLHIALNIWRLPPDQVIHIPNGVDVERYRQRAGKSAGAEIVVGSLGALRGEKNYRRLVRAVAQADRQCGALLRLAIYGEGPERIAIESEAMSSDFTGRLSLPGASLAAETALREFDIFALSSDTEQMPLSLMEAMAAGLPVAATDVGDIRDMVSDENRAFITKAGDDKALAHAISVLASDEVLRQQLGAANAAKARVDFALERMVGAYSALIRNVIATGGRRYTKFQ